MWVRLPMQQVLKNGKPVGVRYVPGKLPPGGFRPPPGGEMAVPPYQNSTGSVVMIEGKPYQIVIPQGVSHVPYNPQLLQPAPPQQYYPQFLPNPQVLQPAPPEQYYQHERASHGESSKALDLKPPPMPPLNPVPPPLHAPRPFPPRVVNKVHMKNPSPPAEVHRKDLNRPESAWPGRPQPVTIENFGRQESEQPLPYREVTREEFKTPDSVFEPVKFNPQVENFRSPPPLPEYVNSIEKSEGVEPEAYDGPVIGDVLGTILQLPEDTPADSDHVPSFAAQLLVVRDAPTNMHPPGYNVSQYNQHHPATTKLPRTKFFCEEREFLPGLYADVQLGCKIFHLCVPAPLGSTIQSFLCPNSTLFDQSILQCNYWQLVDCSDSARHYAANQPLALSYRRVNAAYLPPQQAGDPLTLSMLSDIRAQHAD
ncbi:pollen-specific leucine-rich repeat extensin-like protein 2 [Hyalella azteca]|uniref:Pollen-specific leucine-rich repeat extensin-like protein 2 n=1 Tax=Hyalella azteca TaxID=294128 RepID=A0A8B7NBX9_HYAAZ|nr:pollen-specific leucine-rich repeat extensin-like protein 2 [Hyalella azteca]